MQLLCRLVQVVTSRCPSNDTDLVVDIDGYFAPPGERGLSLYMFAPCRVLDARKVGNGQPFSGTLSPPIGVMKSPCAPPSQAQAYVLNATASHWHDCIE